MPGPGDQRMQTAAGAASVGSVGQGQGQTFRIFDLVVKYALSLFQQ